jgi:hypothetical protein
MVLTSVVLRGAGAQAPFMVWTMNERQAWKANREWVSCVRVSWHSLARGGHVDDSVPQQHNTTSCTPADASTLIARDVATLWSRFSASELKFPDRHFLEQLGLKGGRITRRPLRL